MTALRALIHDHRKLAMLLLALALCTKALMPAGYMLGSSSRQLTVEICSDGLGSHITKQIAIPMDGKSQPGQKQSKTDSVCPYSSLSMASLAGADAPLLALALAFILALGFAAQAPAPRGRISHLRPPLRGPPAVA